MERSNLNSFLRTLSKMRKMLIVFLAIFICEILISKTYLHADDAGVRKFSENTLHNITNILKVEKDPKAIYDQLVKVFLNVMDTNWIGKFVLGPKWNEVPESTQRDYISAYQNYLSSFYAIKFRQYNNQKVSISNVRKAPGDQYIVSTDIRDNSLRKPINISYRIKESSGQYKIRDIVIEGVSILSAQRSEFAKVVINSGVPKLIQLLNAKASQNAASIRK